MGVRVQKFGGSSLADLEQVRTVAHRVARSLEDGDEIVVTVSAMGGETDDLISLTPQLTRSPRPREVDMLITTAERKAAALLVLALEERGVRAQSFSGQQAGISTDQTHTSASIRHVRPDRIRRALELGIVPVVGGSQGASEMNDDTFLGRGGSDTTAVALAAALDADCCELFTDVEGIYTADPRLVPDARVLERVAYEQMVAMCLAGCPKPATRAIELAQERAVAVRVAAAHSDAPGTLIDACSDGGGDIRAIVAAGLGDTGATRLSLIADHRADPELRHLAEASLAGIPSTGPTQERSPVWLAWEIPADETRRAAEALHDAVTAGAAPALATEGCGDGD